MRSDIATILTTRGAPSTTNPRARRMRANKLAAAASQWRSIIHSVMPAISARSKAANLGGGEKYTRAPLG